MKKILLARYTIIGITDDPTQEEATSRLSAHIAYMHILVYIADTYAVQHNVMCDVPGCVCYIASEWSHDQFVDINLPMTFMLKWLSPKTR